jgi:hypothetical protein
MIFNTHLCYGCYSLCMWWHLFSWIYRPNYLLYASQPYVHAPLCMHWFLRLQLNGWLSTYAFMCSVNIPPTEWFITNITRVWMFSIMCMLMYLHITFVEWMFYYTHYRYMDSLQYVYVDVPLYYACNEMLCYIHYRYMDTPRYACVHVPSCHAWYWMLCHKHHRYMDTCHYECVDAPSYCACKWMLYYTHCRHMDALHYVCADITSLHVGDWMLYDTYHSDMDNPCYVLTDVH